MKTSKNGTYKCPKDILKREGLTQRQWESRKRKELKAVKAALGVCNFGAYYCPGKNGELGQISRLLDQLIEQHKCKNW